jgi:hypothetical protein
VMAIRLSSNTLSRMETMYAIYAHPVYVLDFQRRAVASTHQST